MILLLLACRSQHGNSGPTSEEVRSPALAPTASVPPPAIGAAVIGQPAPDFTLPDLDGNPVRLASLKGKTVVLEWFNPECPFVRASHTKGSLVGTADRHIEKGVVWLAINSGAAGKQGSGRDKNLAGKQTYGLKHPILLDEKGSIGKLYGAKTTPHMFVIAPDGTLAYRGAIDNSPDGEGQSPSSGTLVNYVEESLTALAAGKPIATTQTESYGCSVKY